MRSELFTAIGVAIIGIVISFLATNLILDNANLIKEVRVKSIEGTVTTDLVNPDPNLFNYRAINPTVEVYVGRDGETTSGCNATDEEGNCIDVEVPEENQ